MVAAARRAVTFERRLPYWVVHTWDRSASPDGERSFRLDRMRNAQLSDERFEPRPGFDPQGELRDARTARVLYSPAIARFKIERGARRSATAARSARCASAARTGSSARSSPTAARPSCSSPRSCGP